MAEAKKATPGAKKKPSRSGTRLTSTEKAKAIGLWKAGSVTLDQLAEMFDRDRTTFLRLFNSEGISKGESQEAHEKRIADAVEVAALGDAVIIAQRIRETKDQHYRLAAKVVADSFAIIKKAHDEKRGIGTSLNDLKALHVEAQILKITREERYAVLGLNEEKKHDDSPMDDLIVKELTAAEIKDMHAKQMEGDDLGTVMLDFDDAPPDLTL